MNTHPQVEPQQSQQPNRESGFMLVFAVVMIAIVMIATAVAVPVIAKQLRRDKEVESVHRMQQYVRAIQLYQRACKCTNYPPSMDALEKGTNVRFLRQRYVDPLTGKSDWRIIHNPQTTTKGFFGQELTGLVAGLGTAAGMQSTGATTPGLSAPVAGAPGVAGATGATGSTGSCNTVSAGGLASGFNGAQTCNNGTNGSTGSSDTGMFGDSSSGGPIKGVGTSRTGESILTPNDQDTYETWEFWYDPRIELLKKNVNILGGGGPAQGSSSTSSTDASQFGNNLNGTSNKTNNGSGSSTTPTTPTPQ
jgi:type II secretory pathway pseudopilin PulG